MIIDFHSILQHLHEGTVIPAHPLALDENLKLDEQRQRLLTRYYLAAGAGGVAVGVHTTQFEIRDPSIKLLEPVLKLAAAEIDKAGLTKPFIKIAGICGPTSQAVEEAGLANKYGYHFGLLSPGGLAHLSETELLDRAKAVAEIIPVIGFYLQPAVGGRVLSYDFWRSFVEIPNVHAIKVAAFNRYHTLDVVRAVCDSPRRDEIALYTGNDDNIICDLLTPFRFTVYGKTVEKRFVGGLLGHWAVWTRNAVDQLREIKQCILNNYQGAQTLLAQGVAITDCNAAFFDAANQYKGCIAGIHEVLSGQGLIKGTWCLNPQEHLSEGQKEEIDRVYSGYPDLNDDDFVNEFLLNEKIIVP